MDGKTNLKYSVIFLNYDPENRKAWIPETKRLLEENSKNFNYELIEVKDIIGYVNAVNEGLKRATGDFIIVLNDDVYIEDPEWLSKITNENAITSWRLNPFVMNGDMYPDGSCWGLFKSDQEKIGPMDVSYGEGYGCDEVDYFYMAKDKGLEWKAADIKIRHGENQTYKAYFSVPKEDMTYRNAGIFYKKWNGKIKGL